MAEIANRLLQTLRLQRDAFVWMDFEDRATGDAAILVAITRVLIEAGLPGRGVFRFVEALLSAMIFWILVAGLTYAATRFLMQGEGNYAVMLRITGFAYPTFLLLLVTARLTGYPLNLILGSIWFVIIVGAGLRTLSSIKFEQGIGAGAAGILGFIIVSSIFGFGF